MKWILMTITLLSSLAFAKNDPAVRDGNSVGNGGGVICINGVCRTLVEAGLRVRPEYEGVWIPSKREVEMVNDSVRRTPFAGDTQKKIQRSVFGRMDHFRAVEVIDPAKLEGIKQLYIDLAKKAGFPIDPSTFEVVAFSSDNTVQPALTYLLPKFFELDHYRRTDILFHEGMYRGQPSQSLRYVLQLETALLQLQDPKADKISLSVDALFASYNLGLLSKDVLLGMIFHHVFEKRGPSYILADSLGSFTNGSEEKMFTFNENKLIELAEIEPRIPYLLSKVEPIKFQMTDRHQNGIADVDYIFIDSTGSAEMTLVDKVRDRYGNSLFYEFKIVDPDSIDLVIPK